MGKVNFTPLQKKAFDFVVKNIASTHPFYFTGGTALSIFYLGHRDSEDLDFFSETEFDLKPIEEQMTRLGHEFSLDVRQTGDSKRVVFFEFHQKGKMQLKIDFSCYSYKRIEKEKHMFGIDIDSMRDIGTNKLQTITNRTEVKDYVDLYFILKKFTFWYLFYGIDTKFGREYDVLMLSWDFLKVREFTLLPKMHLPLTIEELKMFFLSLAKQVTSRVVE